MRKRGEISMQLDLFKYYGFRLMFGQTDNLWLNKYTDCVPFKSLVV